MRPPAQRPPSRRVRSCIVVATLSLLLAGCTSTDRGEEATTPASIGDPAVSEQVGELKRALVDSGDLPSDFSRVAEVTFAGFSVCSEDLLEANPPAGRLAVGYGNPRENLLFENVLVFTDAAQADAFMEALATEVRTCTQEPTGSGTPEVASLEVGEVGERSESFEIEGTDSSGRPFRAQMIVGRQGNVVVALSTVNLEEPHIETGVLADAASTAVGRVEAMQGNP